MNICKAEGCNNKSFARGYCPKHYRRLRIYGDINYVKQIKESYGRKNCKVEGCKNKHYAKGYCSKHYAKYKDSKIECIIKGCNKSSEVNGYCHKHYQIFKKHRNHEYVKNYKENEKHYMTYTSEYNTWLKMKQRCYNKKVKQYKNYGGRGIKVCDKWLNSFSAFYEDMGAKPFPEAQIDRIDVNGNYESSNCRWVTSKTNNRNRRNNKLNIEKARNIRKEIEIQTVKELAKKYNIHISTVYNIINNETWAE